MKRIHRLLLSGLSGVLLSLAWLGLPAWTLFVAFVPLLYLENYFVRYKQNFPPISFWGHVLFAAVIWNVASAWWMLQAAPLGVASAMLFNSFLISGVCLGAHLIHRNISLPLGNMAFVTFWISFEYLQFSWDMEWPCLQLGGALAKHPEMIQWYEYTGAFGGTLWVLLLNVFLFRALHHVQQKSLIAKAFPNLLALLVFTIMPLSLSFPMYFSYEEVQNPVHFAIVQPNEDPYTEKFDAESEALKRNNFIRLASEVCTDSTDFVVGPETLFENQEMWDEDKLKTNCFILRLRAFLMQYEKAELLFGVSTFKVYENADEASPTARKKDDVYYDRFSTALLMDKYANTQLYRKSKLVMGVEKTPFVRYFPFLKNWFIDVGGTAGTLGRNEKPENFIAGNELSIAPIICFESVFGSYVAEFVKDGAQLIVLITNDGWWKNSRGYKQHLYFSQLRAIETRRSIARAANTGTSCFINQRGDVLQSTPWWEEATIAGSINANGKITYYVKHGDYIARASVFTSVLMLALVFVKRFK